MDKITQNIGQKKRFICERSKIMWVKTADFFVLKEIRLYLLLGKMTQDIGQKTIYL